MDEAPAFTGDRRPNNGRLRWVSLAVCLALVSTPFLSVEFAPITDLPQQASQIRLLIDTLSHPDTSPFHVQWYKPGNASYLMLALSWALFGPLNAGRMAMLGIVLLWVASVHVVAWRRSRQPDLTVLASLFVFSQSLYWGFYGFMLGAPAFLLWFQKTTSPPGPRSIIHEAATWIGAALVLYSLHILWFLFGLVWLVFHGMVFRLPWKVIALRLASASPVIVLTFLWYLGFSESKMAEQSALRVDSAGATLFMVWVVESAFGGIRGPLEYAAFAVLTAWIGASVLANLKSLRAEIDWELLFAGGLLVAMGLFLPDVFMTTVLFNARWMAPGLMLIVLSMPSLPLRLPARLVAAGALVVGFCAVTTISWMDFDKNETSGLGDALRAIPAHSRALGLAMVQTSPVIKGVPSLHIPAYAQAVKGCSLNFSFAEFSSSLVTYKEKYEKPWTGYLEWFPERLRASDLKYFDYAIIDGFEDLHDQLRSQGYFEPITKQGRWRLYRIVQSR